MIPKIIHHCWFGGKPLPRSALRCINSWRKYFPDYEIRQWNELNYDVRVIPYTAEAYDAGKFAFVSDYARFDILYQHGGIYFDTDVEVIKSFDGILKNGAFMGCETDGGEKGIQINPGLGIAAEPGLDIYKDILEYYSKKHFLNPDGSMNPETIVKKTTKVLIAHGLKNIQGIQKLETISIYPSDYFNPFQDSTGVLTITENTHSIHWYAKSWIDPGAKLRSRLTRPLHRLFGVDCFDRFKK